MQVVRLLLPLRRAVGGVHTDVPRSPLPLQTVRTAR